MEHLIQLVQDHPVLYDTSNEDYMRGKMKDEIWEKIAKELNYTSGSMAKTQWRKLRDCFRDALRRQEKKRSGQGASVVRQWVYQKQMEFLIPHMMNRSTSSNWGNTSSVTGAESVPELEPDLHEEVDDSLQEFDIENNDQQFLGNSNEFSQQKQQHKKLKTSHLNEAIMKSIETHDKRAKMRDELRKTMAEKKPSEPNDPLYHFFMSMYNSTKNMPLAHQLRVKKKVFETVSEAEEELITGGTSSWIITSEPSSLTSGQNSNSLSTFWSDYGNTSSS